MAAYAVSPQVKPCRTLALVCLLVAVSPAQQVFRATTSLVNLRFTAWDATGNLVTDLKPDELQVTDNGAAEKLAFFNRSQALPLALGMLVDISGSQDKFADQHQRDLTAFLGVILRSGDHAFLVCFGDNIRVVSEPSPAPATLLWNLHHFKSSYAYRVLAPDASRDGGTALFDAVAASSQTMLATESGQRVLLLYSDGMDNSSANDEMSALATAQRADVTMYTIRYTEDKKLNARDQYGARVMDRLASETGGLSFDARSTPPAQYLPRIAAELRGAYELAYYPTGAADPGVYHRVQIRCTRPGVTIRARGGYTPN